MAAYEPYTWVDRQVGMRGRWQRLRLADLPDPPPDDDKITMQRFATPVPQDHEPHKAAFVLDFDAHADWLSLAICRTEVLRFLYAWQAGWGVAPEVLHLAFSGRAGFHLTIPALLLGDVASPFLTAAYRRWASQIKDTLQLLTLDAPSDQPPEWWYAPIIATVGTLPAAVTDRDAFARALRQVGIYTRRRMIRRENSRHPRSGRFKIPLLPHELAQGDGTLLRLAEHPRSLPLRLAPPTHPGLAAYLVDLIRQEEHDRNLSQHGRWTYTHLPERTLPADGDAPRCIQRLLARPSPPGSSNMPLITLLSYWRARGLPEAVAVQRASAWLLHGGLDAAKQRERWDSARSVGHAVYTHRYRFAHRFIAPLGLVTDAECVVCPLRVPCWEGSA